MWVVSFLFFFVLHFNPPTFGNFFIQVDAPFETIRCCGSEWRNNCVTVLIPQMVLNGRSANTKVTKPCLDLSKW